MVLCFIFEPNAQLTDGGPFPASELPCGAAAVACSDLFHTATGKRRLPLLPDGRLRWTYRHSQTRQMQSLDLEPFELIWRFLQQVLPAGYPALVGTRSTASPSFSEIFQGRRGIRPYRVDYGWLSPAARQQANWVRALLGRLPQLNAAEQAAWQMPAELFDPMVPEEEPVEPRPRLCPQCQRPLILYATWRAGQIPPRPPVAARRPP